MGDRAMGAPKKAELRAVRQKPYESPKIEDFDQVQKVSIDRPADNGWRHLGLLATTSK